MKIGIIGGTGLEKIDGFRFISEIKFDTKYGLPSDSYKEFETEGNSFFFLSRHGKNHQFPPHLINYRANIEGFRMIGVDFIVAFAAVGGINKTLKPGDFLIPDDLVDFTNGRETSFSEVGDVFHIDFTEPFCISVRNELIKIMGNMDISFYSRGVYVCTNGPRLESAAEIKMFDRMGFDVVGMTLSPEAALAREAGICYAAVNVVSNFAAGTTKNLLTTEEVVSAVKSSEGNILKIIKSLSTIKEKDKNCKCGESIKYARFK
ncbi:MAG: S-methyl-5'-thioinosine phosphorylase [Calditerrivibrio sp.]|nr:S-methyl-5'-thioinosine phosphorylase [Calditerrivibrio sp.]MCA1981183.1 S-methyl-5'-thioinosine phosphorylase [Calditerrivibrio sp.]